jgi:NAD(P)-dependent dehydrogenase (short-subunit alcohol dehydrogenase family)
MSLTGKTALVTGATRGIGRAVALDLAAHGATVIAAGRDVAKLNEIASDSITPLVLDVSNEAAVAAALDGLDIDILINNAGVATSNPIDRMTLEDWNWLLQVNTTGVFLCTRAVVPGMKQRGWGRIVTLASVASHGGAPYISGYVTSKHGVLGFTRSMAAELGRYGITANSVCPAYVRTDMAQQAVDNITATTGMTQQEAEASLNAASGLGRLIETNEVTHAVRFFCYDDAGAISGQSIIIDGGTLQQ